MHPYQKILNPYPLAAADPSKPYLFITERHIQAIWLEQKFFEKLKSVQGDSIEVVSPGIWNLGEGPDFLKAHLIISGIEQKGDIEIHLSPESWISHRHHLNERYNNVILHLYFWEGKINEIYTKASTPVVQACLSKFLTISEEKIVSLIDLELYPYKEFAGSGRCASALLSNLNEQKIKYLLEIAADWRLIKKKEDLQIRDQNMSTALENAVARVLGYKKNGEIFLELYRWLQDHKERDYETLLTLSLGICGFFNPECFQKWTHSSFYRHLKAYFLMLSMDIKPLPQFSLFLNQIRPFNHPIRRIVYLVNFLLDRQTPFLFDKICGWWNENWKTLMTNKKLKIYRGLIELIPSYRDPYWNQHFFFEEKACSKFLPLIGDSLKNEIICNAVLPLLREAVHLKNNEEEFQAFLKFYHLLPASRTSKTKYLTHRFFGNQPKGNLLNRQAIHEQGAYQLHRDFCIHYEASCVGCPFVERYNQTQKNH